MGVKAISWAWDVKGISTTDKIVLLALADHANDEGECWPGQTRLASKTELTRETVNRVLKRLEDAGAISSRRNRDKNGRDRQKNYFLHLDYRGDVTETHTQNVTETHTQHHQNVTETHTQSDGGSHTGVTEAHTNHQYEPSIEPLLRTDEKNFSSDGGHSSEKVPDDEDDGSKKEASPKKKGAPNPEVKEFFKYATDTFKERFGVPLAIQFARDGALVKRLLKIYSLNALKQMWLRFMDLRETDRTINRAGISIDIFSKYSNKVVTFDSASKKKVAFPHY